MAKLKPREQGDIGEFSAIEWLRSQDAAVFVPIGHSPDADLVAVMDGAAVRVQVKTATFTNVKGRYQVALCTRGGNQSWNGLSKRFTADRCDRLFVAVADGRRWFIPAADVGGGNAILLGGPKYAPHEVARGRPFPMAGAA